MICINFDSAVCSLTLLCDAHRWAWLHSGMHTAELDSPVGSTPRSLTPLWDAPCRAWLHRRMHTAELDLVMRFTLQRLTQQCASHRGVRLFQNVCLLCFRIYYIFQLRFFKNFWSKKDSLNNFYLNYYFPVNIFRHHREITLVKLWTKIDT